MHRIDTKTAQKDKFGAGKNGFTRGNHQTGTPATDLDDDYFDMLQEELAGIVEDAGLSLDKSRHDQLREALPLFLKLKEAAKRPVGTSDINYIPDMSSFQSERYWQKLPGKIIQWVPIPPHDGDQVINLPIPFPGGILGFAVGAGYEPTSGRITTFAINVGTGPTSTIISRASDFISGGSCILIGF